MIEVADIVDVPVDKYLNKGRLGVSCSFALDDQFVALSDISNNDMSVCNSALTATYLE